MSSQFSVSSPVLECSTWNPKIVWQSRPRWFDRPTIDLTHTLQAEIQKYVTAQFRLCNFLHTWQHFSLIIWIKKKMIEMVVWLIRQTIQTFVNYSEVIKPHEWIGKRCIGYFMLTIPLVGTSGFSIISSTTDWTSLTNWSATPGSVWMCVTHKWTPEGNCKRLRFHPFFVSASVRR